MVQVPFLAKEALVQSTALPVLEQLPAAEDTPVTVNWDGTGSVTCRPVAVERSEVGRVGEEGKASPGFTGSLESDLAMDTSADWATVTAAVAELLTAVGSVVSVEAVGVLE